MSALMAFEFEATGPGAREAEDCLHRLRSLSLSRAGPGEACSALRLLQLLSCPCCLRFCLSPPGQPWGGRAGHAGNHQGVPATRAGSFVAPGRAAWSAGVLAESRSGCGGRMPCGAGEDAICVWTEADGNPRNSYLIGTSAPPASKALVPSPDSPI